MQESMDMHARRRGKRKKTQIALSLPANAGGHRSVPQRIQRRTGGCTATCVVTILLMILALATTVQGACTNPATLNCVSVSAPTLMRYSDTTTDVRIEVGTTITPAISPPLTIQIGISLAGATVASVSGSYSFQPVVGVNPLKPLRASSTLLMQRLDLTFSLSGNAQYELSDTVLTVWVLPLSYPVSTLLGGSHAIGNFLPANASLSPVNAAPVADAQGILRPTVGFRNAEAIVQDNQGVYLYIADTGNHCVRRLHRSTLVIDVVAGYPGVTGNATGVGTASRLVSPSALALDPLGEYLYISDRGACNIKRLHTTSLLLSVVVASPTCIPGTTGFYSGEPVSDGLFGLTINRAGTTLWVVDNGGSGAGVLTIDLTAGSGNGPFAVVVPGFAPFYAVSLALNGQEDKIFLLDRSGNGVQLVTLATNTFDAMSPWAGGGLSGSMCWGIGPTQEIIDGLPQDACFGSMNALLRSADSKTLYVADGTAGLRAVDIDDSAGNAANYGRVSTVVGRAGSAPLFVPQAGGSAGGVHASALFMDLSSLTLDSTRPGWLLGFDRVSNTILSLDPSTGLASPLIHSGGQVPGGGHCAFALGDADGVAADASLFSGTGLAAAPSSVTTGVFAGKMMVADNNALSMVDLTTLEKRRVWSSNNFSGGTGVWRPSAWTLFGQADAVTMVTAATFEPQMSELAFVGPAGVPVTFVSSNMFVGNNSADATVWTNVAPAGIGLAVGGLAGAQTTNTLYIANSQACQILSLSLASPSTTTSLTGNNLVPARCGRAVGLSLVQDVAAADLALQNIVDLALDEPADLLYILSAPPQRSWTDGSWPASPQYAGANATGDALLLKLNLVTHRASIVTGLFDLNWKRDCAPLDGARGVARLCNPTSMALSLSKSFLFLADAIWTGFTYASVIRQVHLPSGTVVTVAGSASKGGCADAPQSTFPILNAMTVANNGQLYVVACFATSVSPTVGSTTPTLVLSGTFAVPPTAVSLVCADPAYPTTPISCTGITGSITAITCSVFTPLQGIGLCPAQQFIIQVTSAAAQLTTPIIYSVQKASGTLIRVSPNSGSLQTGVTTVTLTSDSFFANSAADVVDVRYQKNGIGTLRTCVGGFQTLSIPKPLASYSLGEITDVQCGVDASSAPAPLDYLQFTITVGSVAQPFMIVGAVAPATVFTVIRNSFVLERFDVAGQTFSPAFQSGVLHVYAAAASPFNVQPNLPSGALVTLGCGAASDFLCANTTSVSSTQITCNLPSNIPPSDCTVRVTIGGDSAQLATPQLQIGNRLVLTNVKASVRHSQTTALLSVSLLHNLFGSVVLTFSTASAGISITAGSATTTFAAAPSPLTTAALSITADATFQIGSQATLVIDSSTSAVVLRQFPASDLSHVFTFNSLKGTSVSPVGSYFELQPASSMVITLSFLEAPDLPGAFVDLICGITPSTTNFPISDMSSPLIDTTVPAVFTMTPPAEANGISYSCAYDTQGSADGEFDFPPTTIIKVLSNSTALDFVGGTCGGDKGFKNSTVGADKLPSLFLGSTFTDSPCQLDVHASWPTARLNYTVLNSTLGGSLTFGSTPYLYLPPGNSTVLVTIQAEAGNVRTVTIIVTRFAVPVVVPIVGSFGVSALPTTVRAGAVSTITLSVPVFNTINATVRLICADVAGPTSLAGVVSPSTVQTILSPSPLVFTLTAPNPAPATATSDLYCHWDLFALGLTLPPFSYHVQSIDSSLQSLSGSCLPVGSSTPFAAGTLLYTSTVAWNLAACSLTAVATNSRAFVSFGAGVVNVTAAGSSRSGSLALVVGLNNLTLSVTSESGDMRNITVRITRVPEMVGSFSLSAVPGPIMRAGAAFPITLGVPVFNSITATVQLICSQVNGSTALAGVVSPSAAQSILSPSALAFTVTAPNPPPVTATSDLFCRWELFALGLTLPPFSFHVQSIDITLSALFGSCLVAGSSTPFAPGTLAYTSTLPFLTESCSLTAAVNSARSNLTFDAGVVNVTAAGSSLTGSIGLVVGVNVLSINITAESGDVQIVTVSITRAPDVYVAPGVPPVLTVTVAPSINPCDTSLNPCSPFGSICHSTANISTVDPTADVQKLMSCTCFQGFSGETCDLGIVGCPQCVTSMKGNATMQLLMVGAQWIRRIAVGGLLMDYNATERVYPSDVRFMTAMDANWPAAVKALPYFTLVTFVAPPLSAFTTVTTLARSSFETMFHRSSQHHATMRFSASNVTLVNPRSHYESASIDAVFAGKFIVERTEYRRLWYSSSDCLKPGEMRPDGAGGCECPEGCYCPGGGRCWPQAGYWSATETQIPIACRLPDTCPGTGTNPSLQPTDGSVAQTQTSNCATGYSGVACASCADGYYSLSERCYPCGSTDDQTKAFVTIVIGAGCITIALALAVAFLHAAQLVLVVTAVVVLQSIVTVGQQGARDLPGATGSTLAAVFSYLSVINFDLQILRPGCSVPALTFIDLFWATIGLICFTGLMFFLACCLRFLFRLRNETDDARIVAEKQLALEKSLRAADEQEELVRAKSRELRRQKSIKSGRKLMEVDLLDEEALDEEETKEQLRRQLKRQSTLAAHNFHTPPREDFKRRVLHSFLLLCSIFYLKLNTLQFKMFVCVTAPTPESIFDDEPVMAEFLKEDFQTPCYTKAHLGTTISICILFVFYSFLFPFATYVILCRAFADEAEESGCTSWLVRNFSLFRPSQSKDEQTEEAHRAMREEEQHHKQVAKNAMTDAKVDAKVDAASTGVTLVSSKDAKSDAAPPTLSRSASFAVLPLSTAMTLAYIEHHRMQTFGFLFLHIKHAVFPYRLSQYVINFCFAAITTQVTRIDVQLFLLGFCFVVEALIVAWFLPFETMADNALHGGLDMLLLSHTAVMLSVQSGGEHMSLFFTLVALFGGLLILIALRGRIANFFRGKARLKRSLSKYRGEQSMRTGIIELGRVGTMNMPPRGSPSRSPERSRVAFAANPDVAVASADEGPAVRMHQDPSDNHDENAVARFEAPLSPSNNQSSDPSTPPAATTAAGRAERGSGGRVFVHRDPNAQVHVSRPLEPSSPLHSDSISSPSGTDVGHHSSGSEELVGQGALQTDSAATAAALAAAAPAGEPRKSHSSGSRGNSTPNSARTPNPVTAGTTPQPASPAPLTTPHRSPSASPKAGPMGSGSTASSPSASITPDGTPKQAPRSILVGSNASGKISRGQPRALAIETTVHNAGSVGSVATTAWSAGSASAGAASAGVVAGGAVAASVPSSPQRTVSYKRGTTTASVGGSPPPVANRAPSFKRGGSILRSPPPTLAMAGDSLDSSPATGSPVPTTMSLRAKRLGLGSSTPGSPLTTTSGSGPRSRFGSDIPPDTPTAVDSGMSFGETPKVSPLDAGFLPGTPHAAGSPGPAFGFSPLLRLGHGNSDQSAGESMDALMLASSTAGVPLGSSGGAGVVSSAVHSSSTLNPPSEFGSRSPGYTRTMSAAAKRSTLMSSVLQQGVTREDNEDK